MDEPIREHRIDLPLSAEAAFRLFTERLATWWPREYTWSQSALVTIGIECAPNGKCHEIGPFDFRCDWGRVLEWNPPHRLVFTWQIGPRREPVPDPARASRVEVQFTSQEAGTAVTLVHRDFARHGDGAAEYREAMNSPQGWPYILRRLAEAAS